MTLPGEPIIPFDSEIYLDARTLVKRDPLKLTRKHLEQLHAFGEADAALEAMRLTELKLETPAAAPAASRPSPSPSKEGHGGEVVTKKHLETRLQGLTEMMAKSVGGQMRKFLKARDARLNALEAPAKPAAAMPQITPASITPERLVAIANATRGITPRDARLARMIARWETLHDLDVGEVCRAMRQDGAGDADVGGVCLFYQTQRPHWRQQWVSAFEHLLDFEARRGGRHLRSVGGRVA